MPFAAYLTVLIKLAQDYSLNFLFFIYQN